MAKKPGKKRVATNKGGLGGSVKSTASAAIGEVEKASEQLLGEVRQGLHAVSDKISTAAKSVAETQFAQVLKTLIDDVETIGNDLMSAVSRRLEQLHAKPAGKAAPAKRKAPAAKRKAASAKKPAVAKPKPAAGKQVAAKRQASVKKKVVAKRATASKKVAARRRSAPAKKRVVVAT